MHFYENTLSTITEFLTNIHIDPQWHLAAMILIAFIAIIGVHFIFTSFRVFFGWLFRVDEAIYIQQETNALLGEIQEILQDMRDQNYDTLDEITLLRKKGTETTDTKNTPKTSNKKSESEKTQKEETKKHS